MNATIKLLYLHFVDDWAVVDISTLDGQTLWIYLENRLWGNDIYLKDDLRKIRVVKWHQH